MIAFTLTLVVLSLVLLVRNIIVGSFAIRRIDEVHRRNVEALNRGLFKEEFMKDYIIVGHYSMLFDIGKWTYTQFFPDRLFVVTAEGSNEA